MNGLVVTLYGPRIPIKAYFGEEQRQETRGRKWRLGEMALEVESAE